jgi:hypothetical protein
MPSPNRGVSRYFECVVGARIQHGEACTFDVLQGQEVAFLSSELRVDSGLFSA